MAITSVGNSSYYAPASTSAKTTADTESSVCDRAGQALEKVAQFAESAAPILIVAGKVLRAVA